MAISEPFADDGLPRRSRYSPTSAVSLSPLRTSERTSLSVLTCDGASRRGAAAGWGGTERSSSLEPSSLPAGESSSSSSLATAGPASGATFTAGGGGGATATPVGSTAGCMSATTAGTTGFSTVATGCSG